MTRTDYQTQILDLSDFINGFALKYTRNTELAKDLAQDTILKAITNYDKFRTNTNLKGWLKVIMRNIFINNIRKMSNKMIHCDSDSFIVNQGETDRITPIDRMMELQIKAEIEDLNLDLKVPFKMHMEGFKYKEIADKLSIPMGTVKSRVFQARKKLSECVER
ncbi:RNA polymerase sigma factor [Crocinitomix algicola]|uniref:RNA polymerase sigma factor n=1 Tax=Crocinitomix algicola TaxID=1740263 RepID=UPI0008732DCD|nr:RNA polymerase sigma factor [Crocinitomix algicola]